MLRLRVVQARYGDCLIVENGTGKAKKHVLIDGGPSGVYRPHLLPVLQEIQSAGGGIDLMVLTHVDNDHVKGLLEFLRDIRDRRRAGADDIIPVRRMWHNAFARILPQAGQEAQELEESVAFQPVIETPGDPIPVEDVAEMPQFGIAEGVGLDLAEEVLGIARNQGFSGGLVQVETARRPVRLGSLKFFVLGPTADGLEELRGIWLRYLDAHAGRLSFADTEPVIPPDDSVNNLSSIMVMAEGVGQKRGTRRRILLTGDGRCEDILQGLVKTGLMEEGGKLHVDIFKIPHHGSARNVVGGLFERVTADIYVISADGRHDNPDTETLEWLMAAVQAQAGSPLIFATNWTDSLRQMIRKYPPETSGYRIEVLQPGEHSRLL